MQIKALNTLIDIAEEQGCTIRKNVGPNSRETALGGRDADNVGLPAVWPHKTVLLQAKDRLPGAARARAQDHSVGWRTAPEAQKDRRVHRILQREETPHEPRHADARRGPCLSDGRPEAMLEDVQKALPERRDRVLDGVKLGCRKKDYLCKPKIKG